MDDAVMASETCQNMAVPANNCCRGEYFDRFFGSGFMILSCRNLSCSNSIEDRNTVLLSIQKSLRKLLLRLSLK